MPLLQMRKDKIFDSCEFELNYSNYHSNVLDSMSILSNSELNSFHSNRVVNEAAEEVKFDLPGENDI